MDTLKRFRALLVKALEVIVIVAMAVLFIDVLWGVFSRYVLGAQSRWTEELAIFLLVWISLLGASLTYGEKGHLGVDYFVAKLHPAAQRIGAIAVEGICFLFSAFVLIYGGSVLVFKTWESGQVSPALDWSMGAVYAAAPITGFFFCLFALERIAELIAAKEVKEESRSVIADV